MLNFIMSLGPVLAYSIQRRSAVRYKLKLPVIIHWNDGKDHTEIGFTMDVALDGALILSSRCPPVGVDVRIEVLIPSPIEPTEELRIECSGIVTRVDEHFGQIAFGVSGVFDDSHITRQVLD